MKKYRILSLVLIMSVLLSVAGIAYARAAVTIDCGIDSTSTAGKYTIWGSASGSGSTTIKVSISEVGFSASSSGNVSAYASGSAQLIKGRTYSITISGTSGGASYSETFTRTAR